MYVVTEFIFMYMYFMYILGKNRWSVVRAPNFFGAFGKFAQCPPKFQLSEYFAYTCVLLQTRLLQVWASS